MSRFVTSNEVGTYLEEIESMEECKWRINNTCCNEESKYLGDYTCMAEENRECFERENGVIDENLK